jgi:hypothetical protein
LLSIDNHVGAAAPLTVIDQFIEFKFASVGWPAEPAL